MGNLLCGFSVSGHKYKFTLSASAPKHLSWFTECCQKYLNSSRLHFQKYFQTATVITWIIV